MPFQSGYLTVRQLLRKDLEFVPGEGRRIYVCENPTVLVAGAKMFGPRCAPMVCTQGQLKTSGRLLLQQLTGAGWQLAYHGDFDWPGLQIAAHIIRRLGASPWRMGAADYLAAPRSSVALTDFAVSSDWSVGLVAAMKQAGHCVMEEQVLDHLVKDLGNIHKQ